MNAVVRQTEFALPAQPQRHRFTFDDMLAMQAAGLLGDRRVELIDGEIIDMPEDGELHQSWTGELILWITDRLDRTRHRLLINTTLRLSPGQSPSPDAFIYPAGIREGEVSAANVLLVIEQADSSLGRDLKLKADLYAAHGVRDYWVIDLNARSLYVHREPTPDGYRSVAVFKREEPVAALFVPDLILRLADIPRVG